MYKAALYKQSQQDITNQSKLGKLKPGDRVPSEKELADSFKVSQISSKHALIGLAEEGLIYRVKGKGSVVAEQAGLEPNKNKGLIVLFGCHGDGIQGDGDVVAPLEAPARHPVQVGIGEAYLSELPALNFVPHSLLFHGASVS